MSAMDTMIFNDVCEPYQCCKCWLLLLADLAKVRPNSMQNIDLTEKSGTL